MIPPDDFTGIRVIFCKYMAPGVVLPEPLYSRPGAPVFICRSKEDLIAAIDRHFWRELGIEDPRESGPAGPIQ